MAITQFRGNYFFLSNFYVYPFIYKGLTYQCAEAAFQAQKDPSRSKMFTNLSGAEARALGKSKKIILPEDWDERRLEVMKEVLLAKFTIPDLNIHLLTTGNEELVETNTWRDTFWGVCNGKGENHLGKLLMEIRYELQHDSQYSNC